MSIFRTRYRVVTDSYCGYQAEFRYWWMPMYVAINMFDTFFNEAHALRRIERHRRSNKIVKQL